MQIASIEGFRRFMQLVGRASRTGLRGTNNGQFRWKHISTISALSPPLEVQRIEAFGTWAEPGWRNRDARETTVVQESAPSKQHLRRLSCPERAVRAASNWSPTFLTITRLSKSVLSLGLPQESSCESSGVYWRLSRAQSGQPESPGA